MLGFEEPVDPDDGELDSLDLVLDFDDESVLDDEELESEVDDEVLSDPDPDPDPDPESDADDDFDESAEDSLFLPDALAPWSFL